MDLTCRMDSYSSGGAIERAIYIGDVQQIPPRIERGQKGRVGETMDPDQYMVGSVIEGAGCYNRKEIA